MKRNRGFTLMEMLIVVAIIAVLAAIAIPVFNGSLHKAKVAADMANVRAYYAELQTQLILTGESDFTENRYLSEITFSDGSTVKLQAGKVGVRLERSQGQGYTGKPVRYEMIYQCDKGDHELLLE
jgi:prepilin-type N-terminal cleavage/methylation domain-containing protein